MAEVFHRRSYNPDIIFENDFKIDVADYEKVAQIDSDHLGHVWNLTQNTDRNWIERSEIKAIGRKKSYRSSSFGEFFGKCTFKNSNADRL